MPVEKLKIEITQALSKEQGGPAAIADQISNGIQEYLKPLVLGLAAPAAFGSPMGPCYPAGIITPITEMLGQTFPSPPEGSSGNPDQLKRQIIREVFQLLEENYVISLKPTKTRPDGE